jgi:hypothetical protein
MRVIEGIILREVGIRKVLLNCGGEQRRDRYDDAVRVGNGWGAAMRYKRY